MSRPQIINIELEVFRIDNKQLWIKDKRAHYVFVFKKNKSSISFYVGIRGRKQPYKPHKPFKEINLDLLKKFLSKIDDEVVRNNYELFAEQLYALYKSWEMKIDEIETTLEIQRFFEEKPLATIQTSSGEFVIMASDGYSINLSGGLIKLGRRTFAVVETTYVYGIKRIPTKKGGIAEIKTISPIMIVSEYLDNKLVKTYLVVPEDGLIKIFDKYPVKIEEGSKATSELTTLLDSEALIKIANGEYEPPDYKTVFEETVRELEKYVSFEWDERLYSVVAAYILYTYFYDFFTTSPRLFFLGPYGSGKTRAMITTTYMSRHGFVVLDPSEASTYRSIEAYGPTLGIDESALNERLLKIISAGYKKGLRVPRIEKARGETFVLKLFETYGPVIMAFTDPLPEIIMQRTIRINMERTKDPNPEGRDPEPHDFEELRRKLYALRILRANEFIEAMDKVREKVKDLFFGREYEIWYPILVAAYLGGEQHFNTVLEYAIEDLNKRRENLYSEEKMILASIEKQFEKQDIDKVEFTASDLQERIIEILQNNEGYTEKEAKKKWPVERIGKILRRMGLRSQSKRIKGVSPRKVYEIDVVRFCDLACRYHYECSRCSKCSKFSEKQESEKTNGNQEGSGQEPNGKENTYVSQKLTTPTTLTTKDREKEIMGVRDAIIHIIRESDKELPTTTYYIAQKLEEMMKQGIVVYSEKALNNLESILEDMENQGLLKRGFDERFGLEYWVLGDNVENE
ncbi:MAG: DUF3631 domain-containing protein [Staphylothermus sp.]|nr:DUF3631 domain-containing protein [Staphylothermus sp.]